MRTPKPPASKIYPPPAKFKFCAGPYVMPTVKVGDTLHDEMLGDVTVDGFIKSPIRWPGTTHNKGLHKGLLPIFCDGLVRAVCEENELVVVHYWRVTSYIVDQWKRALTGETSSPLVHTNLAIMRQDPSFRKKFYR